MFLIRTSIPFREEIIVLYYFIHLARQCRDTRIYLGDGGFFFFGRESRSLLIGG